MKWAQLSPIERAYQKAKRVDNGFGFIGDFPKSILPRSLRYQRERNRYYQLLGHWCKLKKANDAQSTNE